MKITPLFYLQITFIYAKSTFLILSEKISHAGDCCNTCFFYKNYSDFSKVTLYFDGVEVEHIKNQPKYISSGICLNCYFSIRSFIEHFLMGSLRTINADSNCFIISINPLNAVYTSKIKFKDTTGLEVVNWTLPIIDISTSPFKMCILLICSDVDLTSSTQFFIRYLDSPMNIFSPINFYEPIGAVRMFPNQLPFFKSIDFFKFSEIKNYQQIESIKNYFKSYFNFIPDARNISKHVIYENLIPESRQITLSYFLFKVIVALFVGLIFLVTTVKVIVTSSYKK
ncbi:hypothetical protein NUSPORA_02357 [Nucleospora cyclopteri]